MTANEMANALELAADRVGSQGSPGYEDSDITSVLTDAENVYVKTFISGKNNRKSEGFDETEIRNQGLSALVKRGAVLPVSVNQTDSSVNGKFFDLPTDFMYAVHEEATIDKNVCGTETPIGVDVIPVGYDEISRLSRNKYKKPYYESYGQGRVWRLVYSREVDGDDPAFSITSKRHEIITDGTFNTASYSINYLRLPKGIIVDRDTPTNQRSSILDASTHDVILDIALSLLLDRVKEQEISNTMSSKDLE
jgi:hypothetical protein